MQAYKMVNVVAPRNAVHGVVNLALTLQELKAEGKKTRFELVGEQQYEAFWKNLSRFIDTTDKTLVILDIPHPEGDKISEIGLEPWTSTVLYLPSSLNRLSTVERDLMTEKGISVIPARNPSESFLGDITDANSKWVNYTKILSLEEKPGNVGRDDLKVAKGIAEKAIGSPRYAIQAILRNKVDFFRELGSASRIDGMVKARDNSIFLMETKRKGPQIFGDILETYCRYNAEPIGISGATEGLFTVKPTFFLYAMWNFMKKMIVRARFGKGAVIIFQGRNPWHSTDYFMGLGQQPVVVLRIISRPSVSDKTFHRWFLGGNTEQEYHGKTYVKKYHGLNEHFPGFALLSDDTLLVPERAFEETVALLHQCDARYEILTGPARQSTRTTR